MKTGILAIALLVGSSVYGQVGQDLKNAGKDTKDAAATGAKKTAKGTKKAAKANRARREEGYSQSCRQGSGQDRYIEVNLLSGLLGEPCGDMALEHIERDRPGAKHGIVKFSHVEAGAEFLLGQLT